MLKKSIIILLVISCLSACGFKLRQSFSLPKNYQQISIISVNAEQIKDQLVHAINQKNIPMVKIKDKNSQQKPDVKTLLIHLKNEKYSHTHKTYVENDTTGYDMVYQVDFSFNQNTPKTIQVSRRITTPPDNILSNSTIVNETQRELQQELLSRLMTRIRYAN